MSIDCSLPPERVSLMTLRAQQWFLRIPQRACTNTTISYKSLFQSLVGCWICEKALAANEELPCTFSLAQEIQWYLEKTEHHPISAFRECDCALLLVSVGILRALKRTSKCLELFTQQLLASMKMQTHQNQLQERSVELFTIRFLLSQLHLCEDPGDYEFHSPLAFSERNVFEAEEVLIRSLAAGVATATSFGQKPLVAKPEGLSQLAAGLPIWMLSSLRQYNLEVGALLLRTMNYLQMKEEKAFQMGLKFLCGQQQLDGSFGFLSLEIAKLRAGKVSTSFDEVLDLYLPLTLSCLWTIAETILPNFVLFRSIS